MMTSDISVYDSSSHVGILGSNVAKSMNSPFSIACATFPGIGGMPAQMYTKLFSFPEGPATGAIFSVNNSASETLSLGFSGNIRTDGVESSTSSVSRSPIYIIYRKDGNGRAHYALLNGCPSLLPKCNVVSDHKILPIYSLAAPQQCPLGPFVICSEMPDRPQP